MSKIKYISSILLTSILLSSCSYIEAYKGAYNEDPYGPLVNCDSIYCYHIG